MLTLSWRCAQKCLFYWPFFFWEPYPRIKARNLGYDTEGNGHTQYTGGTYRDKGKQTPGMLCAPKPVFQQIPSFLLFKSSDRNEQRKSRKT